MDRLGDSELRVMDVLWKQGDTPAKRVAERLQADIGWNKNTSYTLIRRLIDKDAVERREPGFVCHALLSREQVQQKQSGEIVDKLFDGSASKLFAALVESGKLPEKEIDELRKLIDRMK